MSHLLLITDAWSPQTNGVVTTLQSVIAELPQLGITVEVIHPALFRTVPLPGYPEIRVVRDPWKIAERILMARPDTIHIATEGPLGLAARHFLTRRRLSFTTSLHTKFPEYVHARTGLPLSWGYAALRWFHRPASAVFCTTASHVAELDAWGLARLLVWGRGVDTQSFVPAQETNSRSRPRLLYVGRVAVEKNLEDFLRLDLVADKVVVGDGPARASLQAAYPQAQWLGYRRGEALAAEYAAADAFVFPSRTDTFGLVMLEAMACGTPVAAFPVTGPRDVVVEGINGALDDDLRAAVVRALRVDRGRCRAFAQRHSWRAVAERFAQNLVSVDPGKAITVLSMGSPPLSASAGSV
ncbi:MAG: glycosyltransferase family 4 protein [Pseudomonadales bacterium]